MGVEEEVRSVRHPPHFTVDFKNSWKNISTSWKNTKKPDIVPKTHEKCCVMLRAFISIPSIVTGYLLCTVIFVLHFSTGVIILY